MTTISLTAQESNVPLKRCTKCTGPEEERWHPATEEFFGKDNTRKDKLNSWCRKCKRAQSRASTKAHPERNKRIYQEHKEEHKEYNQWWQETHQEHIKNYRKEYNQSHREQKAAAHKKWSDNHQEQEKERIRKYRKTDRSKIARRANEQKRKARKQSVEGTLTAQQIQKKLKAQKCKCYYCLTKFEKVKGRYVYHLEHTIPLSRTECQPRHDENFVVLSCPTCNLKKGTKLPHEWNEGGRLF